MKLLRAGPQRASAAALGRPQTRAFRYRGNSDLDTGTPWYWMPMEAPNYSQLPERFDAYMFNGFGQEMPRLFYNISPNGEHEKFGRHQAPFLGCAGVMFIVLMYVWGYGRLIRLFRDDEDNFNVKRIMDIKKYPFDNNYLWVPGTRANDPNYQAHIRSSGSY
ncbi:hypothetical protein DIPPA_06883 [Diplonema papillatum]|nr:hypothetical protein DIPPA_06883 [Diplonema papillatum]